MTPKSKATPVKDLLSQVLDEVEPLGTLPIGSTEIQLWPVDYISVEHRLIYFDAQTDAMLRYQELQAAQERIQELYAISKKTPEQEEEVKTLASRVQSLQQEITPLVCTYIEALAEMGKGTLLHLLETEIDKLGAKAKKKLPMSLFINKLSQQVQVWTEAKEKKEGEEVSNEAPKTIETEVVENLPEESKLTSTSAV